MVYSLNHLLRSPRVPFNKWRVSGAGSNPGGFVLGGPPCAALERREFHKVTKPFRSILRRAKESQDYVRWFFQRNDFLVLIIRRAQSQTQTSMMGTTSSGAPMNNSSLPYSSSNSSRSIGSYIWNDKVIFFLSFRDYDLVLLCLGNILDRR